VIWKYVKICDDLSRWKGPYFTGLTCAFIQREDCDVFLVFSQEVKLVIFFTISELLDLLTMRELLKLFFTQGFVKKPHIIINNKSNSSQTNKLMHRLNLIIVIGMLELPAIVLIVFLVIFHIINPNLVLLVNAQPPVHH
jgi:hypothetical protein